MVCWHFSRVCRCGVRLSGFTSQIFGAFPQDGLPERRGPQPKKTGDQTHNRKRGTERKGGGCQQEQVNAKWPAAAWSPEMWLAVAHAAVEN
jgi:hypothetical protein